MTSKDRQTDWLMDKVKPWGGGGNGGVYCINITPITEGSHDANFVTTENAAGCHYDNMYCYQWWQNGII